MRNMDDITILEYKNLTELLLFVIRMRPHMFLREAKISNLVDFLNGYRFGNALKDEYFGEDGFLEWFWKKYNIKYPSFWQTAFLDEANDDEKKALELYFGYLDEYYKEK
jgi:hypothetical protein